MGVELAAARAMLDEEHQKLQSSRDQNDYTLGNIGEHNIVMAVLPETGSNRAATTLTQLLNDFSSIRFGLLVGIGGGVPSERNDIRLGDVVVSKPTDTFGGVVQFDRGRKLTGNENFEQVGTLNKPPAVLATAVNRLESEYLMKDSEISRYLSNIWKKYPKMRKSFAYPRVKDQLFHVTYKHEGDCCRK